MPETGNTQLQPPSPAEPPEPNAPSDSGTRIPIDPQLLNSRISEDIGARVIENIQLHLANEELVRRLNDSARLVAELRKSDDRG